MSKYRSPDGLPVDICVFTILSEQKKTITKSLPHKELHIMLIERKKPPWEGKWALPGGFTRENETLEHTAFRELREETNIGENVHMEQLGAYYRPGRDPRGWMPTVVFVALVDESRLAHRKAMDDAADVCLFPVTKALKMELAFDHREILQDALVKIRTHMLTTTIAKEFLPPTFTISELYQVIQTIVPEFTEEKPNFVRKLVSTKTRKGLLEEVLDEYGHPLYSGRYSQRKAKLYRFTNYQPKISIYNSLMF
ncbi:NUDIX domain-containing protein [Brevibacillus ginsengisoli]|uniref:NUDIX domain-containing protein n=1 Tax=Brevibacillus ginsengisoli TaxID=363854 RepID=UPI003CF40F22